MVKQNKNSNGIYFQQFLRWLLIPGIIFIFSAKSLYSQVDARIKLNSADGSTRFEVQNSGGVSRMRVDSAGNVLIVGSCTVQGTAGMEVYGNIIMSRGGKLVALGDTAVIQSTGNVTVLVDSDNNETKEFVVLNSAGSTCFVIREDHNFYPRIYERRFYDDAENGCLSVSTNVYIAGNISQPSGSQIGNLVDPIIRIDSDNNDANAVFRVRDGENIDRFTVTETGRLWCYENIQIGGNTILDSGGTSRITLGDTSTYSSTVTVRGMIIQGDLVISEGRISNNSIVSEDIKDGTITTADIGDRQVTSAKLIVTSTATYLTDAISISANAWGTVMPGMTGTLNVTTAPAMIFVNFSCKGVRGTAGWTRLLARILIGGTEVASGDTVCPAEHADNRVTLTLTGALRVTSTGNYSIVVEWQNAGWGTTTVDCRSLNAFWVACP